MTARDIQRRLIHERHARSFVLPNYTPKGWFECDVFELTKAGYFREYEVKLSRGDFFADAAKEQRSRMRFGAAGWTQVETVNKHQRLATCHASGPTRFWFVVPAEPCVKVDRTATGLNRQGFPHWVGTAMVSFMEVPLWAGLILAYPPADKRGRIHLREVKKAPQLHRCKVVPEVEAHARGVTYWRFLHAYLHGKLVADEDFNQQRKET